MIDTAHRPSGQSGFTLVELLVALAVLGLIAVLLSGSVQFGVRAWQALGRRTTGYEATDAVHTVLRHVLEGAQPMPLVGLGRSGAALYVLGSPTTLDFVGELPDAVSRGGYSDIALLLTGDRRLVVRWRRHVRDPRMAAGESASETELLRDVAGIEFSYFSPATDRQPGGWHLEWTQPRALPALIRLRLRFRPDDSRGWIDLVIAPAIGTPSSGL